MKEVKPMLVQRHKPVHVGTQELRTILCCFIFKTIKVMFNLKEESNVGYCIRKVRREGKMNRAGKWEVGLSQDIKN